MMSTYVAHTIKGLESITEKELQDKIPNISNVLINPKKIIFETPFRKWTDIDFRTFDDLSLLIGNIEFDEQKDILDFMKSVDFIRYIDFISNQRDINKTFSLTVSSYKNYEVDKKKLKSSISCFLEDELNWNYTPLKHNNFDIRVQIEKNEVFFLLKVFSKSLYFRNYRVKSQKGAIRPSIAGAMLYYLTRGECGYRVVDNFCGSGTFLSEALLDGNEVFGGDISKDSIKVAKVNLSTISSSFKIKKLDARESGWKNDFFDIAISNLPWDKQISVDHFTGLYAKSIIEYGRILKSSGSIALIGSNYELMVKYVKKIFPHRSTDKVKVFPIGYLGQNPYIVISK